MKMQLTDIQKKIVASAGTNLLVSAGAGTGKTRVLVERFIKLVAEDHVPVSEILALTFTDKAAAEMKTRILDRFKELGLEQARRDLESCYISTFHAFASRVLKEHPLEAGLDPDFRVMEEEETDLLKAQILDQVIEKYCEPDSDTFKLLEVYGEKNIREGVLKVYDAARSNGNTLDPFVSLLSLPDGKEWIRKGGEILENLGEKDLFEDWKRFMENPDWDWSHVRDFEEWSKNFSRKRKNKELWDELSDLADQIVSLHLEKLAQPQRESFEKIAKAFEAEFEIQKHAQGILDFDDLQKKLVDLFTGKTPLHQALLRRYQKSFRFMMVDEFQDTNAVQCRIAELLSSGNNLFYVGDYKQAIYGFRGASPVHFLDLASKYIKAREGAYAELQENFRSQTRLLNFINSFFTKLWEEDEFRFHPLEARSSESPLSPAGDPLMDSPVQVLWTEKGEDDSAADARRREARAISRKIQQMVDSKTAQYGDIVLLFQSMTSSVISIYEQALKEEGVPYFVVSGRGFYHQPEVRDVIQFLSYLNNPCSDIALAALLRSPLFQIKDDTLFWLAEEAKHLGTPDENEAIPLEHALKTFESSSRIAESEKEKLRYFARITRPLMAERGKLRIAELIDQIFKRTSYEVTVLADTNGIRKYANLQKLADLARSYESRKFMPLGDFIRTIQALENQEVRESEAQVEAEKSGRVVRLMTIHKAKGLEFPIVFAADLGHESRSSESKLFLAHPEAGYGFQMIDPEEGDAREIWSWKQVQKMMQLREKEERKRLFYVAATRAKQKLILSGVYKIRKNEKEYLRDMGSWMEWVMRIVPELGGDCSVQEIREEVVGRPRFIPVEKKAFQKLLQDFTPRPLEELIPDISDRAAACSEAEAISNQIQPLPVKPPRVIDLTVTDLSVFEARKRNLFSEEEKENKALILDESDETLSASDFGTEMHRVLECLDFKAPERAEIYCGEVLSSLGAEQQKLGIGIIRKFTQSALFKEIQKARAIYRELPFVLNERHGRIDGVMDLLYQDATGEWHVVDYKTSDGSLEKVQNSGYETQLRIYSLAVERLLGKTPVEASLCFLKNQWVYSMDVRNLGLRAFEKQLQEQQEAMLLNLQD